MKAFLLAAGHGTRLRPITDNLPKCLVPIRGVPLLQLWLQSCEAFGIHEVLINLHAHKEIVLDYLATFRSKVKVTISQETILLGSAGTLRAHRAWAGTDSCF